MGPGALGDIRERWPGKIGLEVRPQMPHKVRNLFGIAMRGIGKLIHRHPRRARWDAAITRIEMLVEVTPTQADDREVNTLSTRAA